MRQVPDRLVITLLPDAICVNSFFFRFVRFDKKESALSAVAQMHRWSFKGVNIVVEIAHNTKNQLAQGIPVLSLLCFSSVVLGFKIIP